MFKQGNMILIIMLVSLVGTTLVGLSLLHYNTVAMKLANVLEVNQLTFMLWRYGLFGLLLFFWPRLISWIGSYQQWDAEMIQLLREKRLTIALLFILTELFIAPHSLNQLMPFL